MLIPWKLWLRNPLKPRVPVLQLASGTALLCVPVLQWSWQGAGNLTVFDYLFVVLIGFDSLGLIWGLMSCSPLGIGQVLGRGSPWSYMKQMWSCEGCGDVLLVCQCSEPWNILVTCPTQLCLVGSAPLLPFCLLDDTSKDKMEGHFLTVIRAWWWWCSEYWSSREAQEMKT